MRNKLFYLFLIIVLFTAFLTSCFLVPSDPPSGLYRGENKAEYAAANNSILGMETNQADDIVVLQADDYGRKLCLLRTTSRMVNDGYIAALLITQFSDDQMVMYYEFKNVMHCHTEYFEPTHAMCNSLFTAEQINQLKQENDWGTELKLEKAVSKEIITGDPDATPITKSQKLSILSKVYGSDDNAFLDFLTECSDGTKICLIGRPVFAELDDYSEEYYIVVFQPNKSYDSPDFSYYRVENAYDWQQQLKEIMNTGDGSLS